MKVRAEIKVQLEENSRSKEVFLQDGKDTVTFSGGGRISRRRILRDKQEHKIDATEISMSGDTARRLRGGIGFRQKTYLRLEGGRELGVLEMH